VKSVVIHFDENTVLLQTVHQWTGVKKVLEILGWIREMALLVMKNLKYVEGNILI
jgi:hypothetical protein